MSISVLPMGDAAFTLRFDDADGAAGARRINGLCETLRLAAEDDGLAGIVDLIPATRSLTVCFDPIHADFDILRAAVLARAEAASAGTAAAARSWRFPACYDATHGPDLADVAAETGLSVDDVVAIHSGAIYDVFLIGFLPGFPFMGLLDDRLRLPRLATPRTRVPAGAVAIANDRTAIYPWASPGGWRLLARCPAPLFDASAPTPSLLQPGDRVRFAPVDADEVDRIAAALADGALATDAFRDDDDL